jgi:hypothetical protein
MGLHKPAKIGFLQWLDRMPPFWVYFTACNRGEDRFTIANKSGLSWKTVSRISNMVSWRTVKAGIMEKFCLACGSTPWKFQDRDYLFIRQLNSRVTPFPKLERRERKRLELCCRRYSNAQAAKVSGLP